MVIERPPQPTEDPFYRSAWDQGARRARIFYLAWGAVVSVALVVCNVQRTSLFTSIVGVRPILTTGSGDYRPYPDGGYGRGWGWGTMGGGVYHK